MTGSSRFISIFAVLAIAVVAAFAGWNLRRQRIEQPPASAALPAALPRQDLTGSYVSSSACRECHPNQYDSWHASYHRQMTQPATPDAVKASFDGEEFDLGTATARLSRRGDNFWVELFNHGHLDRAPRARQIVMTTGSHHMQGFWVARTEVEQAPADDSTADLHDAQHSQEGRGTGNLLDQLPLMWLLGDANEPGRWVPIGDSFLTPPGTPVAAPWNASCVFCHSVRGQPRLDRRMMVADTKVAELGIACEACHGPGRKHVETNRKVGSSAKVARIHRGGDVPASEGDGGPRLRALRLPFADAADDTIVQPARLPPERSAQVCGHCHSVAKFADDELLDDWYRSGSRFQPGDDLTLTRLALLPARWSPNELAAFQKSHGAFLTGNFWPDGMVRVAGREYNGLVESACYQKGGMTCLSCHSLHQSDPNDQLARGMDGNQACYQCHESYRDKLAEHTHHPAESAGSVCYNCHMPHTTYGLCKGIRSHQISSPSVAVTLATGRPNACNLCHLDQTLEWTAENLTHWYDQPPVELDEDDRQVAAGIVWLLRGDAVERALTAYATGSPEARDASGDDWSPPFLAALLEDDYSAVRLVAWRALRRLGRTIDYDFIGPSEQRAAARRQAVEQWRAAPQTRPANHRLLIGPNGDVDRTAVEELLSRRDDEPITIQE